MSEASRIVVEVAGLSRKGRRPSNEDAADWKAYGGGEALRAWAVVCDGMGGHNAGEVASAMVLRRFQSRLGELAAGPEPGPDLPRQLVKWVVEANAEVYEAGQASLDRRGMGTTLALALIAGDRRLVVANVGDSKIFLVREGKARQLSVDHTALAEQRRALGKEGPPTKEDHSSPFAHALTRSLGVEEEVVPDVLDDVRLQAGDVVILTSDGVTDVLEAEDVASRVVKAASVAEIPEALYTGAFDGGSRDNITAVALVFVEAAPAVEAETSVDRTAPTRILPPSARPVASGPPAARTVSPEAPTVVEAPLPAAAAPAAASVKPPAPPADLAPTVVEAPLPAAPAVHARTPKPAPAPARSPAPSAPRTPAARGSSPSHRVSAPPRKGRGGTILLVVGGAALLVAAGLALVVPFPGARRADSPSAAAPAPPESLLPSGARLVKASIAADDAHYVFRLEFDRELAADGTAVLSGIVLKRVRVLSRGGADLMGAEGSLGAPCPWRFLDAAGRSARFELEQGFTVFSAESEKGRLKPGERLQLEVSAAGAKSPPLAVDAVVE